MNSRKRLSLKRLNGRMRAVFSFCRAHKRACLTACAAVLALWLGVTAARNNTWWLPPQKGLAVLMYHHIAPTNLNLSKPDVFTIEPARLEEQILWLKDAGFTFVRLRDAEDASLGVKALPDQSVLLTFDDGYENAYTYVFPLLKKHQVPAAFFITVELVGQEDGVSWEQLKEMQDSGLMDIGSHSMNHPNLLQVNASKRKNEIRESKWILEEHLKRPVRSLAYPYGGWDETVRGEVQDAGYVLDFGIEEGVNKLPLSSAAPVRRIFVQSVDSMYDFYLNATRGRNDFKTI